MTYYVTFKIDARYVAEVEANSSEQARDMAIDKYIDADFGEAHDIDAEPIIIENENGDYVWEAGY